MPDSLEPSYCMDDRTNRIWSREQSFLLSEVPGHPAGGLHVSSIYANFEIVP